MSRVVFLLLLLSGAAIAHPGHDAPEIHFHISPEILLLIVVLAVAAWAKIGALAVGKSRRSRKLHVPPE